jgi:hypothetical protein
MICNEAAEYVSALCDGETIPPTAAGHIGSCPDCKARLSDYLSLGVELRRTASLELNDVVPSRTWTKPQNRVATWWQKGWGPMRIPRLAFAVLVAGIVVLASVLAVNNIRAQNTGTVVLLTLVGQNGPLADCAISTLDKNQFPCTWYGQIGSRFLAYRVFFVSRNGSRVQLTIYAHSYTPGAKPGSPQSEGGSIKNVWFEPGERLNFNVPQVGALALEGKWMDHLPILGTLEPIPNEIRLGRPLLLKDDVVVGDLSHFIGGIFSADELDSAFGFYIPGEGQFLLSLLPMKGAAEAHVVQGRISFKQGGHSWELVSGVPVCRADHIWVLRQPGYKPKGWNPNRPSCCSSPKLLPAGPGVWVPEESQK